MLRIRDKYLVLICLPFFWLISTIASSDTLHIPLEYSTIQAAIDAAVDSDTVLVADGVYTGEGNWNLTWDGNLKHITVRSENGAENCIIDCLYQRGENGNRIFCFDNTRQDDTDVIDGFTIQKAITDDYGNGGSGIYCNFSSPTITNCIFIDDWGNNGGGIFCYKGSDLSIINCAITENTAEGIGSGIYCAYSSPTIVNSILWNNSVVLLRPCPPSVLPTTLTISYSDIQGGEAGFG